MSTLPFISKYVFYFHHWKLTLHEKMNEILIWRKNNEDLDQKKISETFFGSWGKKYDFLEGGGECRILEKKTPLEMNKKNLDWGLVYWPSHFSRGVSFLKFYIFWIRLCIFFSFIAIFHAFFHAVFSVNVGNRTHICQE